MTVHIFVEGASERALLDKWVPRLRMTSMVRIHPHQGKGAIPSPLNRPLDKKRRGLLDQLPAKLSAFSRIPDPEENTFVVLIDADDSNVDQLIESIKVMAAFVSPKLRVFVQVATEETEAFYLGDLHGLRAAFPDADFELAKRYRPDSICDTWELFGKIVGDDGGNKVAWAEAMGTVLTTQASKSRSPSFKQLVKALAQADKQPARVLKQKRFRHVAKSTKRR
ncbi:MAG: hypothetical protein Q8N23_35755 [Archangium sp.]|nr:hypothetical protein [Archangium sp.]MDP3570512.1 hypothetical protein [Archangium sp.]